MRSLWILASSLVLACAACDSTANNNKPPLPTSYGGGPRVEPVPAGPRAGDAGVVPAPSTSTMLPPRSLDPTLKY